MTDRRPHHRRILQEHIGNQGRWRPLALLSFILMLWAASTPAHAVLTIYRDLDAYVEALNNVELEIVTFNGGPAIATGVPSNQFTPTAMFTACGKPGDCWNAVWQDDALPYTVMGTMWSSIGIVKSMIVNHPNDLYDRFIAFEITGDTRDTSVIVQMQSESYYETLDLNGATGFFGIVSHRDFAFVEIGKQAYENPNYESMFYLDTVLLAPVPEPGTALMALLGVGIVLRRTLSQHRRIL